MADESIVKNIGGCSENGEAEIPPNISDPKIKVKKSTVKVEATSKTNGISIISNEKTKQDDSNQGPNKLEERLRLTREKQMENIKKKVDGLKESELKAGECRRKADDERKKRMEELRRREEHHRVIVEERRKRMLEDENGRRLALMRKSMGRDLKLDQHKLKNNDTKLLNGTKSPKQPQQQTSPQQVKRPHSVAGRPPSYASPTVASTTRMARSSEKNGEVITVCFRCRSAPPDFRSKFLEQQNQSTNGQNRSSHPVFSMTVPAVEFFSARSSNGKDSKPSNGKLEHSKPSVVLRPSETLSSSKPLPTILTTSKVHKFLRPKRPASAVLESSKENTLAMLEARNLKNLQMQKQTGTSTYSPSGIDSKKKPKNRFDLSLDLKKDHSIDRDEGKPKRKDLKKRSCSAIPDRNKSSDHTMGRSIFIAELSVGFSALTPYPSAKSIPSKQQTKVEKDVTNKLECKNRMLPLVPSFEKKDRKGDQLKERGTPKSKLSFFAPKTKFTTPTAPIFEIKKPLPRLPNRQDGEKKTMEEKKEIVKTPAKDMIKQNEKPKEMKKPKDETKKEDVNPPRINVAASKAKVISEVKDTSLKVKDTYPNIKTDIKIENHEKIATKFEKADFITPLEQIEKKDKINEKKSENISEDTIKIDHTKLQPGPKVIESPQPNDEPIKLNGDKQDSQIIIKSEREQEINKKEQERLEKLKKDEEERLNRKKRVDLIMKRVKPDDSSRSSSVEKESRSDELSKIDKRETSISDEMKPKQCEVENLELLLKEELRKDSENEIQDSYVDDEEDLNEEVDGSKSGKSSFFNKLTLKLKKALSPSDKKGFPKEQVNIQDLSGLLLQTALENPKEESETKVEETQSENAHERKESSVFGYFGRISKKSSKESETTKQEESPPSKDTSPPSIEKRKSITEAAFSMFGIMKHKRPSKELEITPEEKVASDIKTGVFTGQTLEDVERSNDDKVMKDYDDDHTYEEERASPIISEYVPGGGDEDGDDDEKNGIVVQKGTEHIDGMDDVIGNVLMASSQLPGLPKDGMIEKQAMETKTKTTESDNKQIFDAMVDTKISDEQESKRVTGSDTSNVKVRTPEMINITSPEMINIVIQKRDEELSTNLSNLDSNPSGSTSSLDIVKSDDSSSGDILMSDESPIEIKGHEVKTGEKKADFDVRVQKPYGKKEALNSEDTSSSRPKEDKPAGVS